MWPNGRTVSGPGARGWLAGGPRHQQVEHAHQPQEQVQNNAAGPARPA